jgi:hypothetical protein
MAGAAKPSASEAAISAIAVLLNMTILLTRTTTIRVEGLGRGVGGKRDATVIPPTYVLSSRREVAFFPPGSRVADVSQPLLSRLKCCNGD